MISGLHAALRERATVERPIRVGLIGAGTFGGMFIRQVVRVYGIAIVAVVDFDVIRAATSFLSAGLDRARVAYSNPVANGRVLVTDDVDLIAEVTGDPLAAVRHIWHAFAAGKDVVNVTVEADALVGPALAAEARALGRTYSFAYGDQPALICEMVDWARTNGVEVVCAGKGTLYQPGFEFTSPDSVWARYGVDSARAEASGYDRRMFTSFVDGTKSAIEVAAVSAATGLLVPDNGLQSPTAGVRELATVLRPRGRGGQLAKLGSVEVVSSINRDGTAVMENLRWGVFVVFEAPDAEVTRRFRDYGLVVDDSGRWVGVGCWLWESELLGPHSQRLLSRLVRI